MIDTLIHLQGNKRACLWTEPLWGIPYNLYVPFASVYMAALGMTPVQIGMVSTLFFTSQMFWALLSGMLTDKLGRRLCTVIFDVLSWSVPAFLWMIARDYRWFVAAALFNGMWRVTENSWGLLLVEEAELGIAAENLSVFSTVKSLLMLVCYFTIVLRVSVQRFKRPLLVSLGLLCAAQGVMLLMPKGAYGLVLLSVLLEAIALSTLSPLTSSIQMIVIEPEERACMLGLFYAMLLLVTAPFGVIAGALSEINCALPLVLTLCMTLLAMAMGLCIARESDPKSAGLY